MKHVLGTGCRYDCLQIEQIDHAISEKIKEVPGVFHVEAGKQLGLYEELRSAFEELLERGYQLNELKVSPLACAVNSDSFYVMDRSNDILRRIGGSDL